MAVTEPIIQHLSKLSAGRARVTDSGEHAQNLRNWIANYLTQPHADLGRAGPVCPFARASIDNDMLWFAVVSGASPSLPDVIVELRRFRETFLALSPEDDPNSLLKAAFILFPNVVDCALIDAVQQALKSEFVNAGLMVGQFYNGCAEPGLWNADFRPLQSPIPLIAIRHMVGSDFAFLNTSPAWIEAYLRRFAPTIPSPVRAALADRFGNTGKPA
jgi:hypothetical protein